MFLIQEAGALPLRSGDAHSMHLSMRHENPNLELLFRECYFRLLVDNVIVLRSEPPNFNSLNWFDLTDFGREWIKDVSPIPEDRNGFLGAIRHDVSSVDSVIEQYLVEGLVAYERRAFFAAAVMLGAANEKALYLLAESIMRASNGQQQKEMKNVIEERSITKLMEFVRDRINGAYKKLKKMPYSIYEGSETHILSLMDSIRIQRNDAVHPAAAEVSQSMVRLSMLSFPTILRKIYELITWFDGNPI